jgi:hypothetical protein
MPPAFSWGIRAKASVVFSRLQPTCAGLQAGHGKTWTAFSSSGSRPKPAGRRLMNSRSPPAKAGGKHAVAARAAYHRQFLRETRLPPASTTARCGGQTAGCACRSTVPSQQRTRTHCQATCSNDREDLQHSDRRNRHESRESANSAHHSYCYKDRGHAELKSASHAGIVAGRSRELQNAKQFGSGSV